MQQRSDSTTMESDKDEQNYQPSRGRVLFISNLEQNSKLKVLVRSHAMREETSPPREPSPLPISPSIKVIPSEPGARSPSPPPSPTSTLVPSSPLPPAAAADCEEPVSSSSSPKYLNKSNADRELNASHFNNNNHKRRTCCDCTNQNCMNCAKIENQERNNNNHSVTNGNNNVVSTSSNTLSVSRVCSKSKLRQQSSSQGSFESSSNSPCLSRDSSSEQYTDTSGIDLELFIPETLNRNAKDRAFMLRIEQELVNLAKDKLSYFKFPPMSSYQRMLVHRCAAYFGMEHNIESSGKCVVVNKTKTTRIPDVEFKEHIKEEFSDELKRSILKRDSNSVEDYNFKSPDRQYCMENRRSKSFEEREEEYEKARRRIFNNRAMHDCNSAEDYDWTEMPPWSSTDSENSSKFRLHPPEHNRRGGKLVKVLSEEVGETMRPYVAKSYSFGGYGGVLNRGDSVVSTHSAGPRLLTKQDSGASSVSWRLSPSSSGYKSQSQMSESVTPSPTSTPHLLPDEHDKEPHDKIVWAVTDIQRVPKGSIIIDPQTGEPLKNIDGSLYHYDPNNLPSTLAAKPPLSPKKPPPPLPAPPKTERCTSPKKRTKYSPTHYVKSSHVVNSSTSPSLPYSPTQPPPNRPLFHPMPDNLPPPQQFPLYGQYPNQEPMPVYQPPCIVYTTQFPQFETRLEPQLPAETYYLDGSNQPFQPQAQPQPYWNQPPVFYPNNQRAYNQFPPSYAHNFLQPPPPPPPPPAQPPAELVYSQMIYTNSPPAPPPNQQLYPNGSNLVYAQNPVYYPTQPPPCNYPQSTSTPNSCASTASQPGCFEQLTHGMGQMGFGGQGQVGKFAPVAFDARQRGGAGGKGARGFVLGSSQSSTGTSSPAGTVVAGYCPQVFGRTPPETPPTQFSYGGNYPPMLIRQLSNPRSNTPGTARSSRSPTPAGDIMQMERQRISLPPNIYQGMPYVLQPDPRIMAGRNHQANYRHPPPPIKQQNFYQGPDNRNHKTRKSKGNKISGLPPSHGKSH